jgi:hypothetical protein
LAPDSSSPWELFNCDTIRSLSPDKDFSIGETHLFVAAAFLDAKLAAVKAFPVSEISKDSLAGETTAGLGIGALLYLEARFLEAMIKIVSRYGTPDTATSRGSPKSSPT